MAGPEEAEKPPARRTPDSDPFIWFLRKRSPLCQDNSQRLPNSSGSVAAGLREYRLCGPWLSVVAVALAQRQSDSDYDYSERDKLD